MKTSKTTLKKNIITNNLITILIPIIIFGFFSVLVYVNNYAETTASKNKIIADTLKDQFETILKEPLHLLSLTEAEISDQPDLINAHMNDYLSNIVGNYDYVNNIEVINDTGKVLYSGYNSEQNIGANRTGEDFYSHFKTADATAATYWSSPYISPSTEQLTLQISRKNSYNHYITVYINLQALSNASLEFTETFDDDLDIAITDEYGIYISHSDITKVYTRLFEPNIEDIRNLTTNDATYDVINYSDNRYVICASKMTSTDWYVIVYQPFSTTFAVIYQLALLLLLVIVVGITLSMIYTINYAKRIDLFVKSLNSEIHTAIINRYQTSLPEFDFEDFNKIGANFNQLMTEIGERDEKLFTMAYNDHLTSLGNRVFLIEQIQSRIQNHPDESFAYIHMDLDDFKFINDVYGHEVGDEFLVTISQIIYDHFQSSKLIVTRIGGDEFGLIVDGDAGLLEFPILLMDFCKLTTNGLHIHDRLIRASFSAGIAHYPEHATTLKDLLQNSDIALLEAKNQGKGVIKRYSPEMKERMHHRSNIEDLLRHAIKYNQFELHYQPQVSTSDGQIKGFEALIRLRDHNDDMISPLYFIQIAEESGMIIEIGEWVIREALQTLKKINQQFDSHYHMSINISTVQIGHPDFINRFLMIIDQSKVDTSLVEFEITESVFINDYDNAVNTVKTLHSHGIKFSLDDFGTGYSSLSYLANLPFDVLKIDRSFVAGVEDDDTKLALLSTIITLGHQLNLSIVAEGVETMVQMGIIKDYGCDTIQGYLYSRPLAYEQLVHYIKKYQKNKSNNQ